jgi:hypothetical protein
MVREFLMLRSLMLGTAIVVAIASPAYANRGEDVLKKRIFEASQQAISQGYTPVTFAEFKAMADELADNGKKIALPVGSFIFDPSGNGYVYPASIDPDGESFDVDKNEIKKIPVGLKDAPPQVRAAFIDNCSSAEAGCVTLLAGHVNHCKWTNIFGNTTELACFATERVYGINDMIQEAIAANRGAAKTAPTPTAPAPANLTIVNTSPSPTPPPTSSLTIVNPPPALELAPTQQASTGGGASSFDKGHADRVLWERFFNGLTGEDRDGALWWASTRSTSQRGACRGSAFFMRGCVAAKAFLDPVDVQRLSDPAYRLGWNTYP